MSLQEPQRYDYLSMPSRPPMHLPSGARVAFWVAPNHEFYELNPAPNPHRKTWHRADADVREYSKRDYGNRVGVWRLIELLDSLGIRGSVSLNAALCVHNPEIIQACVDRNWEHFCHGMYNSRYMIGMSEAQEREMIADCVEIITVATGEPPRGWLSPALTYTERTFDLVAEAGFTYICDLFHDDQPFPVRVEHGRLVSIPYSLDLNDALVYNTFRQTPQQYADAIIDQFDVLYAEGETQPKVMCVPLHPFEVGHPFRLKELQRALEYVVGHDQVWVTTGKEIAEWYTSNHFDTIDALSSVSVAVPSTGYGASHVR